MGHLPPGYLTDSDSPNTIIEQSRHGDNITWATWCLCEIKWQRDNTGRIYEIVEVGKRGKIALKEVA